MLRLDDESWLIPSASGEASLGTGVGPNLQPRITYYRSREEKNAEGSKTGKGCPVLH